MIEANQLTKLMRHSGGRRAQLRRGAGPSTGFLGPNGAGKSTTMCLILGLDSPSSSLLTVRGRPYSKIRRPLFEVGANLEASS